MHENLHQATSVQQPGYETCKQMVKSILTNQYLTHFQGNLSHLRLLLLNVDVIVDQKMTDDTLKELKDINGRTILHYAIACDDKNLVEYLIHQQGLSISDVDSTGLSALHIAVINGCEEIRRLLLALGADPNVKDQQGKMPGDYERMFAPDGDYSNTQQPHFY